MPKGCEGAHVWAWASSPLSGHLGQSPNPTILKPRLLRLNAHSLTSAPKGLNRDTSTIAEADALNITTAARKILSYKKANWAYEREWRILGRNGMNRYYDERCAKSIYFGSRIDSGRRAELMSMLRDLPIAFFEMKVAGYEHKFIPLEAAPRRRRAGQVQG